MEVQEELGRAGQHTYQVGLGQPWPMGTHLGLSGGPRDLRPEAHILEELGAGDPTLEDQGPQSGGQRGL